MHIPLHLPFRMDQDNFPSKWAESKLGWFCGGTVSQSLQVQPWMRTSTCLWAALNTDAGHSLRASVKPLVRVSHPRRSRSFLTTLQKGKAWKTGRVTLTLGQVFPPQQQYLEDTKGVTRSCALLSCDIRGLCEEHGPSLYNAKHW